MPPLLARLTTCLSTSEAAMLCGLLRSEGIEAIANDTHLQTVDPLSSPALGFVSIDVRREDLERAREVLGEKLQRPPTKRSGESGEDDACPACGKPLAEESAVCTKCGWTDETAAGEPESADATYVNAMQIPEGLMHRPGDTERAMHLLLLLGFAAFGALGFFVSHGIRSASASGMCLPGSVELLSVLAGMALFGAWLLGRRRTDRSR